jgi:hypothetical protein
MCKKLIISFFLLPLFLGVGDAAASFEAFQFPPYAKGVSALKGFVKKNQEHAVHYQSIAYKNGREFLVINHNTGTGVTHINVYVYGCEKEWCKMFAMRYSFDEGLIGELSPDKKELILKSEKGVVYLRMPFNWPQPPKEN